MSAMVQDDSKHRLIVPNALHHYTVNMADLPLSCPMPGMMLWNSHPKVYLPIEATLSFSAIYEMLEAGSASILSPQRLEEFVGMQGDPWDSQEDMLMAGLGSVVAMICVHQVRKRRARAAALRELEYAGHAKS